MTIILQIFHILWVVLKACSVLYETDEHESNILLHCLLYVSCQFRNEMSAEWRWKVKWDNKSLLINNMAL